MWVFVKRLVFVVFLAVVLIFTYQNLEVLSQAVRFRLEAYGTGWQYVTPDFPLVFLFIVFFLVGMVTAGFHGLYERFARRAEVRKRDRRIRELEEELGELRAKAAELRTEAAQAQLPARPERGGGVPEGRREPTGASAGDDEPPTL